MSFVSRFIDRLCVAIYLRGHRAWSDPHARELEKNNPKPLSDAERAQR